MDLPEYEHPDDYDDPFADWLDCSAVGNPFRVQVNTKTVNHYRYRPIGSMDPWRWGDGSQHEVKKSSPAELLTRLHDGTGDIIISRTYRHIKTGNDYVVMCLALRESDLEQMVVYAPLDQGPEMIGVAFVRPVSEFKEKFE